MGQGGVTGRAGGLADQPFANAAPAKSFFEIEILHEQTRPAEPCREDRKEQSDAGKRALATSTYTGFVAPSAEVEAALLTWLGI